MHFFNLKQQKQTGAFPHCYLVGIEVAQEADPLNLGWLKAIDNNDLSIKIGMSDCFAYSAPPTAAVSLGVACASTSQRRAESKQG